MSNETPTQHHQIGDPLMGGQPVWQPNRTHSDLSSTDWITAYLDAEASRVRVADGLDVIEGGLSLVRLTTSSQPAPRRLARALGAIAAAVGIAVVGAAMLHGAQTPARDSGVGAPTAAAQVTPASASATTPLVAAAENTSPVVALPVPQQTVAPQQPDAPQTVAPVPTVPLPGGATVQGQVPTCTATDEPVVFDCTLAERPDPLNDVTGTAIGMVDATSHISGGCRATTSDGLRWMCYIGARAYDEKILSYGILGDWAPSGFSAA
jgi:hypothetical protein